MDANKKREILFRGKDKYSERWYEGFILNKKQDKIGYYNNCMSFNILEINPETVGQFTGLIDLNGKKIFEGDILADYFGKIYGVVEYGEGSFDSGILKYTGFYCKALDNFSGGNLYNESDKDYWDKHQVIGNIYDNPEFLKLEK